LTDFRARAHRASAASKTSFAGEAMAVPLRWLRRRVFGIPRRCSNFACRGFREADPATRQHLVRIGRTFVDGDHVTLEDRPPRTLAAWPNAIDAQFRGFAFEEELAA
jgi:hypothetical protein